MNDRLEEIKARMEDENYAEYPSALHPKDIKWLISALESARAEIARQRQHRKWLIERARTMRDLYWICQGGMEDFAEQCQRAKIDLARWKARAERLEAAIRTAPDCKDHSCRYALTKSGMRTNGGCRCTRQDIESWARRIRAALEE